MKQNAIFRGKTELGVWVYGYYMYSELQDKHFILGESKDYGFQKQEVISETVGQFTGLTDKNLVEIFEGDVCKTHTKDMSNSVCVYYEYGFLFKSQWDEVPQEYDKFYISTYFEVIGNIHDNPELLNS